MYKRSIHGPAALALLVLCSVAPAQAQQAVLVHRLGHDTLAVEQYTRTAKAITGEVVSRGSAAVTRLQYEVTLGKNGRPVSAVFRSRSAAGAPLPNQPTEVRLTFVGDSVRREAVLGDSTNTRMLPAVNAVPMVSPARATLEAAFAQLRKSKAKSATYAAVGIGMAPPGQLVLEVGSGDTIRAKDVNGTTVFLVDADGRLLALDAMATAYKQASVPGTGPVDMAALAARLRPTGTLSARGVAHGSFMQSVVFIDYGRPQVRGRSVWGGDLVPWNQVWRAGANEATHLATTRELVFGDVVVPPGIYTLFMDNTQGAPKLVINRQVGQWGTVYDAGKDLGRVPLTMAASPQPVEEFTITIRSLGGPRGAIELAWGDQVATATFTAR